MAAKTSTVRIALRSGHIGMRIKSLTARGLLSFAPDTPALELGPLNVLIGANGSGKSNVLELVRLLKAAPTNLGLLHENESSVPDWIWKGEGDGIASAELVFTVPVKTEPLRYRMAFRHEQGTPRMVEERLEYESPTITGKRPYFFIEHAGPRVVLNRLAGRARALALEQVELNRPVLSQIRDPDQYPELSTTASALESIRLYGPLPLGRTAPIRGAQSTGGVITGLREDGSNLALVLSRLVRKTGMRERINALTSDVYPGTERVELEVYDSRIRVVIVEKHGWTTPASRLSEGTLRWLFLLAVLLDEENSSPVFLDEPETALHPDALVALAALLKEASQRVQVIVTTQSASLIDHFSDHLESVVALDKVDGATVFSRLDPVALEEGLEKYTLGELWAQGHLGGNRW